MDIKPGLQTTEWWVTLASTLWGMFSPSVPAPLRVLIVTIVPSLYTIVRGLVKWRAAAAAAAPPVIVAGSPHPPSSSSPSSSGAGAVAAMIAGGGLK